MKFDKPTMAAFAVCIVFLFAWQPICVYMGWIKPDALPIKPVPVSESAKSTPAQTPATPAAVPQTPADAKFSSPELKSAPVELANKQLLLIIEPSAGYVSRIVLNDIFKADRVTPVTFDNGFVPGSFSVSDGNPWEVLAAESEKVGDVCTVSRTLRLAGGQVFSMTQQWELKPGYQILYRVKFHNPDTKPLSFPQLRFMTSTMKPLKYMTGDDTRSESFNVDYFTDKFRYIDATDMDDEDFFIKISSPVSWIGVDNKYFAFLMLPSRPFPCGMLPLRVPQPTPAGKVEYFNAACAGLVDGLSIMPGESMEFDFKCFAGPKHLNELAAFHPPAQQVLHLSMFAPMEWISRQLLKFLIYLKEHTSSWGWSIIILTIIVRLVFWPVTQKANASMKKMQKLQPLVQELKAKYKDNQQLMNTKMMELYKEHKVNPLGGCLPILLQIPVFIALYSTIDSSVELRHASFMWAKDLAQPDTIFSVMGLGFNPLVLIMTGLMLLQQKLTPQAADPMQQKIMMMMPLIMLFVLYSLPSGLTLYWTVSQIISILQLLINQKLNNDDATASAKAAKTS